MEENCQKNMLKLNESINQEDEKMPLFLDNDNINNKEDLFQEEYDLRSKNSFFFLRSPLSKHIILEAKPDSKKKRKKKKKPRIYFHSQFKEETKNNKLKPIQKKKEKNSYINLQPRKTWLNCQKIYNRCLKKYIPETMTFENKFNKNISQEKIITKKNFKIDLEDFKGNEKPKVNYKLKGIRTKSLRDIKFSNYNFILLKNNLFTKSENNFVKCLNKTIDSNFINNGINNILEKINMDNHLQSLREFYLGKNKEKKNAKKKLAINLSFKFERKRPSLLKKDLSEIEMAKKMGIDLGFKYKINSFFDCGTNIENDIDSESNNDIEIVAEKGNYVIKQLNLKSLNLGNKKDNQSDFNFFCLKNIFRLEEFYIFGLISGKGKESIKCSRLLKKILIDKLTNENNYIFNEILESNKFDKKIDYILHILTFNEFEFLKKIFNSLEEELNKMGVDIDNTGAMLSLIIFIKEKVISVKIGDICPYFVYNIIDENLNNNLMIRNPHFEHNIENIYEQYRLEENKCEIKINKNNRGRKSYLILNNNDKELENYLNVYNIKCTRMIGFKKLKKIGIINEPEINTFSMVLEQGKIEGFQTKRKSQIQNPHVSDIDFLELIKLKGINFSQVALKFVIIGNHKLFKIMKNSYYIKEINEAIKKDEIEYKNKDNIKFCFNLKNIVRKLLNDAVELNKKFSNNNNFKDLSIYLVTLVEN